MSNYYLPNQHNGVVNSVFNNTDWNIVGNDSKYVKLTGSTMTGGLSCVGITSTGGTNNFMTNITLPSTYSASPNTSVPSSSQLGGSITLNFTPASAISGTITNILTISLPVGVWLMNYRVGFTVTSGSGSVSSYIMSLSTTSTALDIGTRICDNATATISSSGNNNEVADIGICYLTNTSVKSYYLNYYALFSGTIQASGYITAIRIG